MQSSAVVTMIIIVAMPYGWAYTSEIYRPVRRTNVRAVLASKMDPKFWPARGRRSSESNKHSNQILLRPFSDATVRRQTTDEDGPFWANRGRSLDFDLRQASTDGGPFWANRGRSIGDDGPFWANRGRSTSDDGPFWANRGRSIGDDGPFWANRGRSLNDETSSSESQGKPTDWSSKERDLGEEGPFWANRGRSIHGANSVEDGPFWANRGRSLHSAEGQVRKEEDEEESQRLRRNTLFVEEPGFVTIPVFRKPQLRRNIQESDHDFDTFFGTRGKKEHPGKPQSGSLIEPILSPTELDATDRSMTRERKNSQINRALDKIKEAQFWAARGKKEQVKPLE